MKEINAKGEVHFTDDKPIPAEDYTALYPMDWVIIGVAVLVLIWMIVGVP